MALEKMVMLNLVGAKEDEDALLRQIILMGNVHLQSDISELYESNFTMHVFEESLSELQEEQDHQTRVYVDYHAYAGKLAEICTWLTISPDLDLGHLQVAYDLDGCTQEVDRLYTKIKLVYDEIQRRQDTIHKLEHFTEHIKYIRYQDIHFEQLKELHYFGYRIGTLSSENRLKLQKNYENITAIVLRIGREKNNDVFFIMFPKEFEGETDRILKSLNFKDIHIPEQLTGTPNEMLLQIDPIITKEQEQIDACMLRIDRYRQTYGEYIRENYTRLKMQQKIENMKEQIEHSNHIFFLSGWVPKRDKTKLNEQLSMVSSRFMTVFKDTSEFGRHILPPSKLKNPRFLQPFEGLVKMYGIPSYNEIDPTLFLGITYLLMFGAMFGDVGQGLIFVLAGLFFGKKKKDSFIPRLLVRVGISSTIFGFLYGSLFGFEDIIPPLLFNPIYEINTMLAISIGFGVILLIGSFICGIWNSLRQEDIEEGIFGRNGVAGLVLYMALLGLIYDLVVSKPILNPNILALVMVGAAICIVVRQPLTNLIRSHRPLYHETVSEYYVESGFDIVETFLSLVSNTLSFIRIGAFALNHVGLFMAFFTLARLMNTAVGSVSMLVIGNVIILCLEGLIVCIQALRLQYYELFGKYFRGDGVEFYPVCFIEKS